MANGADTEITDALIQQVNEICKKTNDAVSKNHLTVGVHVLEGYFQALKDKEAASA
jgi:hypothetical protein